jgi:drug/metabolite transporter (DMT)-like permease
LALALYVGLYAVLNAAGLLLLRAALKDRTDGTGLVALLADPRLIVGLVLYGLGFATWILSLRRYQLTTVYPVFVGVSYVSVLLAAVVILDESMSLANVLGVALIGAGVLFVVR